MFLAFGLALPFVLLVFSNVRLSPKPISHYAVDESPSYVVWYAVEAFPVQFGAAKRSTGGR
jgi:hypothetical protein